MADLMSEIAIDFSQCVSAFDNVKSQVLQMEAQLSDGILIDEDKQLNIRSFNVRLIDESGKPLMYNNKQISALTSVKSTDTLESISKSKYTLVESTTKKGKPIGFYLRDSSAGTAVARAWAN